MTDSDSERFRTKVVTGKRGFYILRWFEVSSGRWRERSTKIAATERNRGSAHQLLAKLQDELAGEAPPNLIRTPNRTASVFHPNEDSPNSPNSPNSRIRKLDGNWDDYLEYFRQNHLSGLSAGYGNVLVPIVGKFQESTRVRFLQDINAPVIRRWITTLQAEGLATATLHSYWGHLSSFLRLAVEDGILKSVPKIRLPKIDRRSMSKGRALSGEEFDRILAAADQVRPVQAEHWRYLLRGLWFAGLRIGEAYRLSWDASDFCVDLDRKFPAFVIQSAGQKNRKAQTLPMAPEFAELLRETPTRRRSGKVFRFLSESGNALSQETTERVISEIGETANVKVSSKKTATAHDLRRSFGSRWALRVMPQVLQQLMRHADIQTTMRFYVDLKSDDLGEIIYKTEAQNSTTAEKSKTGPKPAQKRSKAGKC